MVPSFNQTTSALEDKTTSAEFQNGLSQGTKNSQQKPTSGKNKNKKVRSRSKKANHQCNICGKTVASNQNLKLHLRTHDKNRAKYFSCDECDYKTDHKWLFSHHQGYHKKMDEKLKKSATAVRCEKCPKVLKNQHSYRVHLCNYHKSIHKLQCDLCPYETQYKANLRKHASKHQN